MSISNKIVEKIQKLLSLANSDNENEAKSATQKANELLLKYNLDLQSVKDHQLEYEVNELKNLGLTLKPHQKLISQILMNFFFVQVVIAKKFKGHSSGRWGRQKAQWSKTIQLLGTKENCQIASYIFDYLDQSYPKLWQEYFSTHSRATQKDRISYYTGLTVGINTMLRDTKWKVEQEAGLVLKEDPGLQKFVKEHAPGNYSSSSQSEINHKAYSAGVSDGEKITLRKPIVSDRNEDSTKRLK